MFPSCLDLTGSFNILFFILQLFSNPVTNLCVPIYIRIFRLNVVHFAAQQFLVLVPKKLFCLFTLLQQFQEVKCKFQIVGSQSNAKNSDPIPTSVLIHSLLMH